MKKYENEKKNVATKLSEKKFSARSKKKPKSPPPPTPKYQMDRAYSSYIGIYLMLHISHYFGFLLMIY